MINSSSTAYAIIKIKYITIYLSVWQSEIRHHFSEHSIIDRTVFPKKQLMDRA